MASTHAAASSGARPRAAQSTPACPACGALARRSTARFCATCGRTLSEGSYLPADALRASYHLQRQLPQLMPGHQPHRTCVARPAPRRPMGRAHRAQPTDGATQLARTFITYALLPYLGLLFWPGVVVCGLFGLWRARRTTTHGAARAAARYVLLGLVICGAQLFLWWVLYSVGATIKK